MWDLVIVYNLCMQTGKEWGHLAKVGCQGLIMDQDVTVQIVYKTYTFYLYGCIYCFVCKVNEVWLQSNCYNSAYSIYIAFIQFYLYSANLDLAYIWFHCKFLLFQDIKRKQPGFISTYSIPQCTFANTRIQADIEISFRGGMKKGTEKTKKNVFLGGKLKERCLEFDF